MPDPSYADCPDYQAPCLVTSINFQPHVWRNRAIPPPIPTLLYDGHSGSAGSWVRLSWRVNKRPPVYIHAYTPKCVLTQCSQNDLSEYFSLLNFANPNYLGSKLDFRKNFENAIIRGRDADATDEVKAECEKRLKELGAIVSKFIIRRTNDLLSKYCECISMVFRHTTSAKSLPRIQYLSSTSKWCSADHRIFSSHCIDSSYPRLRFKPCTAEKIHSH